MSESGTREILDLAVDVPTFIPGSLIERENPDRWQAQREKKRDWVAIRYGTTTEAEKYRKAMKKFVGDAQGRKEMRERATRISDSPIKVKWSSSSPSLYTYRL